MVTRALASATTLTAPDTTAPSAPTNLAAGGITTNAINLSWTASTDNVGVTGYLVERCQGASCSNYAQIGTASGTSYPDSGLTASTTYRYRVRATDAAGNLSGYSAVVNATTLAVPDTTPPSTRPPTVPSGRVPGSLGATAASASQINLSWTASTDNVGVTGYQIERCTGAGCSNFAPLTTVTTTSLQQHRTCGEHQLQLPGAGE